MIKKINLTFGDLVAAVCEATADQNERTAALADLTNRGKVQFTGQFARASIEWVEALKPAGLSRRAA